MSTPFKTETETHDGHQFLVEYFHDQETVKPWEEFDGNGAVTDWVRRAKRPGELVLNRDRGSFRYYDFAEACKIALRDGWSSRNCEPSMTKRQQAATAARDDFEYFRAWCNDEWFYCGIVVTLLTNSGDKTDYSDALWGVEYDTHSQSGIDKAAYLDDMFTNVLNYTEGV